MHKALIASLFMLTTNALGQPTFNDYIDHELETWLTEPEIKDMSFSTLMNWQMGSVKDFRAGLDDITTVVLQGDSQDGINGQRSGGALDEFLRDQSIDLLAFLFPYFGGGGIIHDFDDVGAKGGWVDNGTKTYGDDWGDGNTTHHISYGTAYELSGTTSGFDFFGEYLIPIEMLPQMTTGQEMTYRIFYRKVNANNITANIRPVSEVDGVRSRGGEDNYVEFESGDGFVIGYVDFTLPTSGTYTNPASVDAVGFRYIVSGSSTGSYTNAVVQGNELHLLGVLAFPSETSNGKKVLDTSFTEGVVFAPLQSSGYDASETMRDQERIVRVAVTSAIADMLGDGSTPAADPIDTIYHKFGHNNDTIASSYTAGLNALRAEWDTVIAGSTTSGSVRHLFFAPWGYKGSPLDAANNARMEAQATQLAEYCHTNNHGFINEWLYYGGINFLQDLTGNDPFDNAYGSYVMDVAGVHPDSDPTAEQIWLDRSYHSITANIVSSFDVSSGLQSRNRDIRNRER